MPLGARPLAPLAAASLLTGCLATTAPPPSAIAPAAGPVQAAAPAPPPPAWPDAAGGCRALAEAVLALPEPERRRLSADASPFALAVADGVGGLVPAVDAAAAVEADVPLRAVDRVDDEAPCLLVLGRGHLVPGGGRRLVGHEVVRSEYRAGTRRAVNPEYRRLREAVEAEEDGRGDGPGGGSVMATGDPMLDLIGLAGNLVLRGVGRLRPAREDPAAALARTERYLETATFEPYTYRLASFEVGRTGVLEAALVDRAAGTVTEARHTLRERRTFPVAEGRHRADRGLLEGTGPQAVLPADVALFEAEPPRPPLSDLLRLLAATSGQSRPGGVGDALASLSRHAVEALPAPAAGDQPGPAAVPASAARVVVHTADGPVEAAWTDAERVEVPTANLGRSRLVEVEGPDGMRTFGMVERVDKAAGRAVVRVNRPTSARRVSDEGLDSVLRDLKDR